MATDPKTPAVKPKAIPGNIEFVIPDPNDTMVSAGEQTVQFTSDDPNESRTFIILVHTLNRDSVSDTKTFGVTKQTDGSYLNNAVEFPEAADVGPTCSLQAVSLEVTNTTPVEVVLSVVAQMILTIEA